MTWTDAKIATIKRMWAEGYSSGYIGNQVGKSRNAVIGKLGRMGLVGDPEANRKRALVREQAGRKRRMARQRTAAPISPPVVQKPPRVTPAPANGIPIEALTNTTCRWPVHDQLPGRYCGAHSHTGRYCPEHEALSVSKHQGRMA